MESTPTSSSRPWDPTAPSLLWAHEIRRENIRLLNQLTTTQSDLSKTIHALSILQQTVSALERTVQDLRARENNNTHSEAKVEAEADAREALGRRVTELGGGIDARFAELERAVEGVKGENKRLEGLVDGVKDGWGEALESAVGMQVGMVMSDMRDMMRVDVGRVVDEAVGREMEGLQCGRCYCGRGMFAARRV